MRTHGPTRIALAVLAVAATTLAAGCGSSSDSSSTAPEQRATGSQSQEAPAGARARACKSSASVDGEVRVTGGPCGMGDLLVAAWHKNGGCSAPAGASRTSCKLGPFTCLGAATDRGLAVNCAAPGRSIGFIAKPR